MKIENGIVQKHENGIYTFYNFCDSSGNVLLQVCCEFFDKSEDTPNGVLDHYESLEIMKSDEYKEDYQPVTYEIEKALDKLYALEMGGVDNWEWYDEALSDWHEQYQ